MELICDETKKARKEHSCNFCGLPINKGNMYNRQVAKIDDIYTWKSHLHCNEIASRLNMYDDCWDEGVTTDNFHEIVRNYVRETLGLNVSNWPTAMRSVLKALEIKEDGEDPQP